MSWFQATNFASLAKSALKEAQKTIDRALELKEEEEVDEEEKDEEEEEEEPADDVEKETSFDQQIGTEEDEKKPISLVEAGQGETKDDESCSGDHKLDDAVDLDDDNSGLIEKPELPGFDGSLESKHVSDSTVFSQSEYVNAELLPIIGSDDNEDTGSNCDMTGPEELKCSENLIVLGPDEGSRVQESTLCEPRIPEAGALFVPTEDETADAKPVSSQSEPDPNIFELCLPEASSPQIEQELKVDGSSTSSSDIEVIPADVYEQSILKEVNEAGTQTEDNSFTGNIPTSDKSKSSGSKDDKSSRQITALEEKIAAKDKDIEQLRSEGEKLSKKQLELSNIIKKLRAREKEKDDSIKSLKSDVSTKCTELERLMNVFVSKESVEQSQIDTISKLTAEKRKLEAETERLKSELEDAVENCNAMKVSVENTSLELLETQNMIAAVQRDAVEVDRLTKEKSELLNHNETLRKEVEHLRTVVNDTQKQFSQREMELKSQLTSITSKCHQLEDEISNVSSEVADATMPLSMEIEKLQQELTNAKSLSDKREKSLHTKIQELEQKLTSAQTNETSFNLLQKSYEQSVSAIEAKLEAALDANKQLVKELHEKKSTFETQLASSKKQVSDKVDELNRVKLLIDSLEQDLRNEQAEKKKYQLLAEQIRDNQAVISNLSNNNTASGGFFPQVQSSSSLMSNSTSTIQSKPTGTGHGSGENSPSSQSILSEVSYSDEVFDPYNQNNHPMTPKSFFENFSSFSNVENLYAQLRQKDGELYQYHEEAAKNEKLRKTLNEEIAQLTVQNQELQMSMKKVSELENRLGDVEKNYNAVLQMYGEKVEEAEELRLDLEDVKQMYKAQIDQLLQR